MQIHNHRPHVSHGADHRKHMMRISCIRKRQLMRILILWTCLSMMRTDIHFNTRVHEE